MSNFVNKPLILAYRQRKALKNMTGDYLWLCLYFLFYFGWFFASAGRDGKHLLVIWLFALIMVINLFKCALNAADSGL